MCGKDIQLPCQGLLVTFGTTNKLSFSNSPHLDKGDKFSKVKVNDLLSKIDVLKKLETTCEDVKSHLNSFGEYITKFHNVLGLTAPTTCLYQEIKHQKCNIVQFFVMQGLGSYARLGGFMSHHFYAPTFVHNTSVCLAVDKKTLCM